MPSILLVVERPATTALGQRDHNKHDTYDNAVKGIRESAGTSKSRQALAENVLLISIDETLDNLAEAVRLIYPASYRYAILPEDIRWQKVDKPSTKVCV